MRMPSLLTLLFISTPLVLGFVIITPSSANGWRNSGSQLLEWQLAGSDPATFAVVLTSVDGAVNQLLAVGVDSSRWSTDVSPPSGGWPIGSSFNFRVNFVKDANDSKAIYATSQLFNIEAVVPMNTTTSGSPVQYYPTSASSTIPSNSSHSSATPTFSSLTTKSTSSSLTTKSTSSSLTTKSTSSSLTTKSTSSSTTSSIYSFSRLTTSPAKQTTTLTSSHHLTNLPYSTFPISTAGTNAALRAGSSISVTVQRTVLWGTFGILGFISGCQL